VTRLRFGYALAMNIKNSLRTHFTVFFTAMVLTLLLACSEGGGSGSNSTDRSTATTEMARSGTVTATSTAVPAAVKTATAEATQNSEQDSKRGESRNANVQLTALEERYPVVGDNCTERGPVMFTHSPIKIEDIKNLTPYGQVVGAHVTPIDHMYIEPTDVSLGRDVYEVVAIQDALIFDISPRDIMVDTNEGQLREWRIDMAHTCTFVSYLDLLTSLTPEIEKEWAKTNGGQTARWNGIVVKAGQVVGYIGGRAIDFAVYDYEIELPGLINPSAYAAREPWKIHTVDPFQYFPTQIRDALLRKMIRAVEPRAGKIDYDVDATISGNWFQIGTDGYNGINQRKYWEGHLSIAPHEIDPTIWRIGVGYLETEDNNFLIFGDQEPLEVNISSGPKVYELRRYYTYIPAKPDKKWWNEPYDEEDVYGVKIFPENVGSVLVELQEDRLLRVEVFLGIEKENVSGFTNDARLYER